MGTMKRPLKTIHWCGVWICQRISGELVETIVPSRVPRTCRTSYWLKVEVLYSVPPYEFPPHRQLVGHLGS